jgi:ABC-type transport system substrate-binding protein
VAVGGNLPTLPVEVYTAFQADPARGRVYRRHGWSGRVLNVAVPPFDDLHISKALNLAIDKQDLVDRLRGPVAAEITGHGVPDNLEDYLLVEYDPYATPRHRGDLDAARGEIARSRYDSDRDGRCDATACEHVRALTRDSYPELADAVKRDLAPLGIDLDVEVVDEQHLFGQPPDAKTPLLIGVGFTYNHGAEFLELGNESHHAFAAGWYNYTMVGATLEQLRDWGYEVTAAPPNVDDRVEACVPLVGAAQLQCVAFVDMYLMENVLAMVPLTKDRYAALASPRVLTYGFDEMVGTTALDQIALKP